MRKIKDLYLLWCTIHKTLPKAQRYSLGQKIDSTFINLVEATVTAGFLMKSEKIPYVRRGIQKCDTLKVFLLMVWETKAIDNATYIALSERLNEIGKMLGGWNGQLTKQNSPQR